MKILITTLLLVCLSIGSFVQAEDNVTIENLQKQIASLQDKLVLKERQEKVLKEELKQSITHLQESQANKISAQNIKIDEVRRQFDFFHNKIMWSFAAAAALITFLIGLFLGKSDVVSGVRKLRESITKQAVDRSKDEILSKVTSDIDNAKASFEQLIESKNKENKLKESAKILVVTEKQGNEIEPFLIETGFQKDHIWTKPLSYVFDGHDSPKDDGYDLVVLDDLEEGSAKSYLTLSKQPAYLLMRPHSRGHYKSLPADKRYLPANSHLTLYQHTFSVLGFNDSMRNK